jgi:hypothetical protein
LTLTNAEPNELEVGEVTVTVAKSANALPGDPAEAVAIGELTSIVTRFAEVLAVPVADACGASMPSCAKSASAKASPVELAEGAVTSIVLLLALALAVPVADALDAVTLIVTRLA